MKPSKDERELIAEVVRAQGFKNVKGISKMDEETFTANATRNMGKTVYYSLKVTILSESFKVEVESAYS